MSIGGGGDKFDALFGKSKKKTRKASFLIKRLKLMIWLTLSLQGHSKQGSDFSQLEYASASDLDLDVTEGEDSQDIFCRESFKPRRSQVRLILSFSVAFNAFLDDKIFGLSSSFRVQRRKLLPSAMTTLLKSFKSRTREAAASAAAFPRLYLILNGKGSVKEQAWRKPLLSMIKIKMS